MDYEPSEEQEAIVAAVEALLARHAGAARAIELNREGTYDDALHAALAEAGFLQLALGDETGPLEAALLVEAVSRHAGVASVSSSALVAPLLLGRVPEGPVAMATDGQEVVRYLGPATTLLVDTGDEARVVALGPGDSEPVRSNFGYPMARPAPGLFTRGETLGAGSGERLRSAWRVALAVEAAGAMKAAIDTTVDYLTQRRQFGRPIGSFQAVQHRLAECAIVSEGSRWLACEAAWQGAPAEQAAIAAAYATSAATQVFAETHQLSGAIGFTHDHDLHVWSMRLQALKLELGGVAGHRRAVTRARWALGPA